MRFLTLAPLPKWRHLLSVLFPFTIDDRNLAAPWCRSGNEVFLLSRSALSLAVVAIWRQRLEKKKNLTFWVPDFFCNASLQPLRDIGIKLIFYPVTDQLIPNMDSCRILARQRSPDLVLLVHYFGRPSSVEPIVSFCKEQEAFLIEDAAHALRPVPGIGEAGDFVLYSPHKHLPISDGAVLVLRLNGPAQLAKKDTEIEVLREICSDVIKSSKISNYLVSSWLIKRILQLLGFRSRPSFVCFRSEVNSTVSKIRGFGMSTLSKRLLYNLKDSLDEVAFLRAQNAIDWQIPLMFLSESDSLLKPIFSKFTPYLACFTNRKEKDIEVIYKKLQDAGLPILTWPDLPPEVMENTEAHHSAITLRHTHLYAPVHQSLNQQLIHKHGKGIIEKSIEKWKVKEIYLNEWEEYWQCCSLTNLLQSWQYGSAKEQTEGWQPQRFLISDASGKSIALAQVLVKKLPVLGGVARLNRGPLMLIDVIGEGGLAMRFAALSALIKEARSQRWWMIQIAPELPNSDIVHKGLLSIGLRYQTRATWASGVIDLSLNETDLLSKLNRRWKRGLRKVSDLGVTVRLEELTNSRLNEVLDGYTKLQERNNFNGINVNLVKALSKLKSKDWACNLFVASRINEQNEIEELGYRLCIHHGDTVTDFLVSTNEKGKQTEANTALYWGAILHAKRMGCHWFDVGGLSDVTTPKGIAEFKRGLNSNLYELAGEWRKYSLPSFWTK